MPIPASAFIRHSVVASCFAFSLVQPNVSAARVPPDVLVDRYLLQVERLSNEQNYPAALEAMDRIVALRAEHDLEVPEEVSFVYAQLALSAGAHEAAIESVSRYLAATGRTGEFYTDALQLWDRADVELEEARRRAESEERRAGDRVDAPAARAPGSVFRDCPACPEMLVMPAGTFRMGCEPGNEDRCYDFEIPGHRVQVTSFAMSTYEVTRAEYAAFVRATDYRARGCRVYKWRVRRFDRDLWGWESQDSASWREPGFDQGQDHPVVCVSWEDAQAYAQWLSAQAGVQYRLPSEAEWEYAARAGTTKTGGATASGAPICERAWA